MNYKLAFPDKLDIDVKLPASKSITNRVLLISKLAGVDFSDIQNIAVCDDSNVMLKALSSSEANINIGAAGTAMRFLTSYFAIQEDREIIIDGSERMRNRPIKILVDALRNCGADIEYALKEGYPPLKIKGKKLHSATRISLPGNVSSQYISSLMMIAPLMKGGLQIDLTGNVLSADYINMTLAIMKDFGIRFSHEGNSYHIEEGRYIPRKWTVESDWSASSYWFEMAAIHRNSKISLQGLNRISLQGDSAVKDIFKNFGVSAKFENGNLYLQQNENQKVEFLTLDLKNQPDLAQTVITTSCMLDIPFKISGLSTLKIKETDRIEALRAELHKLGYIINVDETFTMSWNGNKCTPEENPTIKTYDDHRMAMAFAPCAILFNNIRIDNAEVVSKSYPEYWEHLKKAGVKLIQA